MKLYPIKFFPIYKDKLWGGNNLINVLNRDIKKENIGESWEVSTVKYSISRVKNDYLKHTKLTELIKRYPQDILGQNFKNTDRFPLLLKIIDATKKLSVQVHPNNDFAKNITGVTGKSEFWYILKADKKSHLYIGLNNIKDKKVLKEVIRDGKIENHLNKISVKKGNFFYIPAGTVHSIGKKIMLVEIQQNSNTTYRLYDWNRTDQAGNYRKLDLKNGIKAVDLARNYKINTLKNNNLNNNSTKKILSKTKHFVIEKFNIDKSITIRFENFGLITCIENSGKIIYNKGVETISLGESLLLPAKLKQVRFEGEMKLLYAYTPKI